MATGDEQRNPKNMHLHKADVKLLLASYLVLSAVGSIAVLLILIGSPLMPSMPQNAALYCAAMSLTGSGLFYVRKLYKALINGSYNFHDSHSTLSGHEMARIGTLAYFMFRPLYGVVFSLVVYCAWRLSLSASGAKGVGTTDGFLYTTVTLGFISGFLAGRLLTVVEGYGSKKIATVFGADR